MMNSQLESTSLAPENDALRGVRRPPFGLRRALRAAGAALQWRLLLWWVLLLVLPAIVAALPVWRMLSANLDYAVHAPQLAARLDMLAIADIGASLQERWSTAVGTGGMVALALTLLLSPLLSGMTIAAARAPGRLGMGALLTGGAQEYPRMLRTLVWAVVPLGIAGLLAGAAFRAAGNTATNALLETDAAHASRSAALVALLVFVIVHATVDAGRALLGSERQRKSAVVAWFGGVRLLLRRPLALLGSYVVITAIGLTLAALLALARVQVPALGAGGTVGAILLAQLIVVVLGWMRSARLFALMALARDQAPR
ncbi:hypothetical protein [Massilia phyllosphaerae]|uniref:hypothetical protein n=1 Tax=Massilia phyllosphaerae TaxID=3106034 RepID=UPI002B1CB723|nr:hypothetical protein [Massilia sp. SGZ-792]